MKSVLRKLLIPAAIAAVIAAAFAAGYLANNQRAPGEIQTQTVSQAKAVNDELPSDSDDEDEDMTPGLIRVTPAKQQMMGIKLTEVRKAAYRHLLKVPGRVAADETRIYQINAAVEGWITKIYDNATTGGIVKKDQLLALYASPNFLSAQQSYLNAMLSQDRYGLTYREKIQQLSRPIKITKQYRDTLSALGMTDTQIDQITENRDWDEYIQIRAPGAGFILKRNVTQGLRFDKGTPFYTIADLSRVWIIADLYENDTFRFEPGKAIRIALPGQNKSLTARVSGILPQFDPASRTLKLRLEAANPGFLLRPDMFVDVELPVALPPGIFIPADAVLDTGIRKTVFVAHGQGAFEPRPVTTGRRLGNVVEIEKGLAVGERIVLSGNFLLDAESKMELVATGSSASLEKDPVCGMEISPQKAQKTGRESLYQGKTYYFCSDACKQAFDANPERYARQTKTLTVEHATPHARPHEVRHGGKRLESPVAMPSATVVSATPQADPVCGMNVNPKEAQVAKRKSVYRGETYYFCSDQCEQAFDANPGRYLQSNTKQTDEHAPPSARPHEDRHGTKHAENPVVKHSSAEISETSQTDPVCGMNVEPLEAQAAGLKSIHKGKTYFSWKTFYFCSDACKQAFDADPERYLRETERPAGALQAPQNGKHEGMRTRERMAVPGGAHSVRNPRVRAPRPTDPNIEKRAMEHAEEPAHGHSEKHVGEPLKDPTQEPDGVPK